VATVPGGSVNFATNGGQPPYVYTFAPGGNESGADPITSAGIYTAGPNPNSTDVVLVTDALGNTAQAPVAVGDVSATLPTNLSGSTSVTIGQRALLRGDFNGDGVDDVMAVYAVKPATVQVVLGGINGWQPQPPLAFPTGLCAWVAGDFNGDGIDDLAVGLPNSELLCTTINLYYGQPSGGLLAGPTFQLDPTSNNLRSEPALLALPVPASDGGSGTQSLLGVVISRTTGNDATVILLAVPPADEPGPFQTTLGSLPLAQVGTIGPLAASSEDPAAQSFWILVSDPSAGAPGAVLLDATAPNVCPDQGPPPNAALWVIQGTRQTRNGALTAASLSDPGSPFPCIQNELFPWTWLVNLADLNGDGIPDLWAYDPLESPAGILIQFGEDGGFGAPQVLDLTAFSPSTATARVAVDGGPAEIDLLGGTSARLLLIDGGLSANDGGGLLPNQWGAVSGTFSGSGYPDVAVMDPNGVLSLIRSSFSGDLATGGQFRILENTLSTLATLAVGTAPRSDGLDALLVGANLEELDWVSGPHFSVDFEAPPQPLDPLATLMTLGDTPWGASLDASGAPRLWRYDVTNPTGTMDWDLSPWLGTGGTLLELDPLNLGGDGGTALLLTSTSPELTATLPLLFDSAGRLDLDAGAPFLMSSEPTEFARPLSGAPGAPDDLVELELLPSSGLFPTSTLQILPAVVTGSGFAGWSTTPSSQLTVNLDPELGGAPVVQDLSTFALKTGGPRSAAAVVGLSFPAVPQTNCPNPQIEGFVVEDVLGQLSQPVPLGSFTPPPNVTTCSAISQLTLSAEDIDGDGNTDLLLAVFGPPGGVAIWWGDGTGKFSPPQVIYLGASVSGAIAGHFRSTSFADIAAYRPDIQQMLFLLNQGSATAPPGRAFR
jgi:hypothetical protein